MAKTTSKGQNVSTLLIRNLQLSIPSNKSSSGGESPDVRHKNDVERDEPRGQIALRNSAVLSPWIAKEGNQMEHNMENRSEEASKTSTTPALHSGTENIQNLYHEQEINQPRDQFKKRIKWDDSFTIREFLTMNSFWNR